MKHYIRQATTLIFVLAISWGFHGCQSFQPSHGSVPRSCAPKDPRLVEAGFKLARKLALNPLPLVADETGTIYVCAGAVVEESESQAIILSERVFAYNAGQHPLQIHHITLSPGSGATVANGKIVVREETLSTEDGKLSELSDIDPALQIQILPEYATHHGHLSGLLHVVPDMLGRSAIIDRAINPAVIPRDCDFEKASQQKTRWTYMVAKGKNKGTVLWETFDFSCVSYLHASNSRNAHYRRLFTLAPWKKATRVLLSDGTSYSDVNILSPNNTDYFIPADANHFISLPDGKGSHGRLFIDPETGESLRFYIGRRLQNLLFIGRDGARPSRNQFKTRAFQMEGRPPCRPLEVLQEPLGDVYATGFYGRLRPAGMYVLFQDMVLRKKSFIVTY